MVNPIYAANTDITVRPSVNGKLHVEGCDLKDEEGRFAELRGVSTHGLTWYPDIINEDIFKALSSDWNCNLIRLAMYSDIYSSGGNEKQISQYLMIKGIEAAIKADMYILVDWHILNDNNPNQNIDQATEFFDLISKKYKDCPNILYEICNEPNGTDVNWDEVYSYSEKIIPVIRNNNPDAVIIVGTPNYDQNVLVASEKPLPFDNLMYTLHFYTASHYDELYAELKGARNTGVPVFITECGISEASGDGKTDYTNSAKWFSYLKENHIGYAVWSFSDKKETSAMLTEILPADEILNDENITETGLWVRSLIRGEDPAFIEVSHKAQEGLFVKIGQKLLQSVDQKGISASKAWNGFAVYSFVGVMIFALIGAVIRRKHLRSGKILSYSDYIEKKGKNNSRSSFSFNKLLVCISGAFTLIYFCWRIKWSVPFEFGFIAVAVNLILLVVEMMGFLETLVHYRGVMGVRDYPLPLIDEEDYPEVDIFIATYNEPESLLRKTVNGCKHLEYPDKNKVHIWICDDNRRKGIRALAQKMGVGYFDRDNNEGAKAGNLNNALSQTSAPYIVTLDADMIVRSEFLMKTIPYFVDMEKYNEGKVPEEQKHLGLLQTPQCFYDPDVFQHTLYSERRVPNEQDFFYRTIEVAKTDTNSVIYGGSNTVLSRKALESIGGFYTKTITEDFATGLLIEEAGYLSLGLPKPLASGVTPDNFKEHIKQRTRWARGVIDTARKLHIIRKKGLNLSQKISYLSSVSYWYSPLKNLIYILSPLVFAVFAVPVFRCSFLELFIYWFPMFILQEITLRRISSNRVSTKWSGIYESSVMPYLLIPVIKESLGMSLSAFKVTDKSGANKKRYSDKRGMLPFIVLIVLSVIGIVRVLLIINGVGSVGLIVIIFWMIRNLYFMVVSLFLLDGRESDNEAVYVYDAEDVVVTGEDSKNTYEGITTRLTEHSISLFLDEEEALMIGDRIGIKVDTDKYNVDVYGVVIGIRTPANGGRSIYLAEILDFNGNKDEYLQILYDRIPTLPQNLNRDVGIIHHLWVNFAKRAGRARM
ncbi:MAG: cellulase family glycosylhydrolase [Lachnospiraceae bacterium]|nr:cellulase family glycosylhydrolase [Lachnospiraceae bacterium]